jgi:hypothetical protein
VDNCTINAAIKLVGKDLPQIGQRTSPHVDDER